jgi:transcriptional regulator
MYQPPHFREDALEIQQQETLRVEPWKVDDAPEPFVAAQISGIVGIEVPIARIEGKWKVRQNRPEADRAGVQEGLLAERGAAEMAALVAERGQGRGL